MSNQAQYAVWTSEKREIIEASSYRYNNREEAIKAAETCAIEHPGVEFYVVTLDTLVTVNLKPTITRIPTQSTPR